MGRGNELRDVVPMNKNKGRIIHVESGSTFRKT